MRGSLIGVRWGKRVHFCKIPSPSPKSNRYTKYPKQDRDKFIISVVKLYGIFTNSNTQIFFYKYRNSFFIQEEEYMKSYITKGSITLLRVAFVMFKCLTFLYGKKSQNTNKMEICFIKCYFYLC